LGGIRSSFGAGEFVGVTLWHVDAVLLNHAAATAAIRHLKSSQWERDHHQDRAARLKLVLNAAGLPVMPSDTHIVPLHVGDPEKCKMACDLLLSEYGIYIQPIN
jgi:5-aminolevulinate synthase